ncbi:uncharacterized protein Dmoj_GI19344 [Drosophila mojavensis]|uniref:Alpha-carbonic anhydrase domain-containing protein n=1 Tax=Drosophila mojavensis TaxID=7230 RepID=B4KN11_DROMO|nr:uncharacterized protein Dmoj_GI19344 [Drosophila mojavensis]
MFDTTLGMLVSWLAQGVCLLLSQAWQHPLIATGVCLLLSFFNQADEQLRKELGDELRERFQGFSRLYPFSYLWRNGVKGVAGSFDYTIMHGPHTWTQSVINQSPVNIDEQVVQRLAIRELLNWNHYDELPASIVLENTGQTLLLRAQFRSNVPTISGADLLASYTFVELCFHWGWSNSEGSEHTLNHRKFPLEMQVLHRTGASVRRNSTSSYDLLMIAYVFELSAHNPFLDPLMQNLKLVQQPGKRVHVAPFPLSYLIYPFRTGFYSYGGSLTRPPCYQGTEWFIFPESLAISDFQLRHFRQLLSADGVTPISRNSRPVQQLGNRIINLNYFCPYDATQLARMRIEVLQQQQQELDEEQVQSQSQQDQQKLLQQQQPQMHQPQQAAKVHEIKATVIPNSDDEGQLIETLDTTTTITTSSSASICTTVLKRDKAAKAQQPEQQQQQASLQSCCPNSIIFFSTNNKGNSNSKNNNGVTFRNLEKTGSEGDNSLINKCHGHYQLEQAEDLMLTVPSAVPMCGMGDGLGVGVTVGGGTVPRVQLIE